jgi:pyruvate dehydrogenase E1 component beta subunit
MDRQITYIEAINEALHQSMELDENVIKYGLGVDDPKSIFGSTIGLKEKFGNDRVFDMPTSENAMTGVAIGASLNGIRPVMVHQRIDFFLLAMDQLVNNAAKWHFMFNNQGNVPITIRLILGRGWGQGPTHSQNFHSWFSHIPGLKVVMPSTPHDAKGLLIESIFDNNPVLFIEQRWLHNTVGNVPQKMYRTPLGKANLIKKGSDISIVSMSIMTVESLIAAKFLEKHGISVELIDLRTINPIDWNTIFKSIKKTGRLLAIDNGHGNVSVASEIVSRVSSNLWSELKAAPKKLAMPDFPESSSPALTKNYHVRAENIVLEVSETLGININCDELKLRRKHPHDVPGEWFKGPF